MPIFLLILLDEIFEFYPGLGDTVTIKEFIKNYTLTINMTGEVIDRCPSGIIGYDTISQGGFVRNSSNVIVGGPGSGKSTFLLEFLYNGATKYHENGLYCSFEPDILDTLNDAFVHGWDFFRLAEEGRIKFIKFSPETSIAPSGIIFTIPPD